MQANTLREVVQGPVQTVLDPLTALWTELATVLPNLIGVAALLAIGLLVSKALRSLATALLARAGFDGAASRIGVGRLLENAGLGRSPSELMGGLVFWLFMLTFVISAADTLGLPNVSRTIDSLVRYLPNVIGAALILVIGLSIADLLREFVLGGARGAGVEYAGALGQIAYAIVVVVTVGLGIGQLQVETQLLNRVVEILLMAGGGAIALSLGLGTRDLAHHLVAGVYARDAIPTGRNVTVGEVSGRVVQVGPVFTTLERADGSRSFVPNAELTGSVVELSAPGGDRPES